MEQVRPLDEEIKVEDGSGGSGSSCTAGTEDPGIDLTTAEVERSSEKPKPHVIIDLIPNTETNSEFRLQRLLEEPDSHRFYCPNCKACIQKIEVRKDKPVPCANCYSILVLIGGALVSICKPGPGSPRPGPFPSPGKPDDQPPVTPQGSPRPGPIPSPEKFDDHPLVPSQVPVPVPPTAKKWDILKSIVYGGLLESITSLNIVTSAAGADVTSLKILALGFANLIGGLFLIGHNLIELRNYDQPERTSSTIGETNQQEEETGRYYRQLGLRENFKRHAAVTVISFILFGMVAPVTYSFSFLKSGDNKDLKLVAVATSSLVCITILAIAKAYIQKASSFYGYLKIVLYLVVPGFMASGLSYVVGDLIKRLMEKLDWLDSTSGFSLSLPGTAEPTWGFY